MNSTHPASWSVKSGVSSQGTSSIFFLANYNFRKACCIPKQTTQNCYTTVFPNKNTRTLAKLIPRFIASLYASKTSGLCTQKTQCVTRYITSGPAAVSRTSMSTAAHKIRLLIVSSWAPFTLFPRKKGKEKGKKKHLQIFLPKFELIQLLTQTLFIVPENCPNGYPTMAARNVCNTREKCIDHRGSTRPKRRWRHGNCCWAKRVGYGMSEGEGRLEAGGSQW